MPAGKLIVFSCGSYQAFTVGGVAIHSARSTGRSIFASCRRSSNAAEAWTFCARLVRPMVRAE